MQPLHIVSMNHPALHSPAEIISPELIRTSEVHEYITAMRDLMRKGPGVGLAINQVGQTFPPLIVIEDLQEYIDQVPIERRRQFLREKPIPFHALFSPTFEPTGNDKRYAFVSCLSVPGMFGAIPWHWAIRVNALNEQGNEIVINASGWYSLILQHEIAHLEGLLFTDLALEGSVMTKELFFAEQWMNKGSDDIARVFGVSGKE